MDPVCFRNTRNQRLIGVLHTSPSDACIIMAHGFTADKSSLGRFEKLADSFNASGYNVLRFDFSGCGESDGTILGVEQEIDDLKSAVSFVQSRGFQRIGFYGHSLGTLICLRCFSPAISTMVLSGALTDRMRYDWSEHFSAEQLKELDEKGRMRILDRTGQERTISQQMLRDFELIDQRELLKNVSCPVLIIHGADSGDQEESQLLQRSSKAMTYLSGDSRLEVIEGARHSLGTYLDKAIDLSNAWFRKNLPLN